MSVLEKSKSNLMSIVLSEEIETTMRCMGVASVDELNPSYVNTKRLELELPDDLRFGASWTDMIRSKL